MKANKTKVSEVASFLTKTGFIFEMKMAEFLKKQGYQTRVNQFFFDLDGNKKREIDIIATKKINKVLINLIIECKQSIEDDWVFICLDKNPFCYYYSIKHSPRINSLSKSKIFNSFHIFDEKTPLAQNYLVFKKKKGKKSDAHQIEECLFKLPKALLYIASKADTKEKTLFFPIGLFNKNIFVANYDKRLIVKKHNLVQYFINFESENYIDDRKNRTQLDDLLMGPREALKQKEINGIIKALKLLTSYFQIDFVGEQGLKAYLDKIEKDANSVSVRKWSFNISKKK